ncbi:MAG: hypothetical protein EU529_04225 [Promethearchaeota archaeon]|nr:MAG: hypothetical protein EU529_04225 [Candidatus Lokiarchaeota archaeon]
MNSELFSKKEKVLPNFLGIGVKRGGTTWLYEVLKRHPKIFLCPYIKETRFFDKNYNKGIKWYKKFFPNQYEAKKYTTIGEIVPTYLCYEHVPKLVQKILPSALFIIMLRNPIERAISEYKYDKLNFGLKDSFEIYLRKNPEVIEMGYYAKQIKYWLKYFPLNRFLILTFEEVMNNKIGSLKKISKFLNIELKDFNFQSLNKKINISDLPKMHKIYLIGYKINDIIIAKDLYRLSDILSRFKPFLYILGNKKNKNNIDPNVKRALYLKYKEDIAELEIILNMNFKLWEKNS